MVFDIDQALSQSIDNPVYYVQLSHARICGLLRQVYERGLAFDLDNGLAQPLDMGDAASRDLLTDLARWPDEVEAACEPLSPHQVATGSEARRGGKERVRTCSTRWSPYV